MYEKLRAAIPRKNITERDDDKLWSYACFAMETTFAFQITDHYTVSTEGAGEFLFPWSNAAGAKAAQIMDVFCDDGMINKDGRDHYVIYKDSFQTESNQSFIWLDVLSLRKIRAVGEVAPALLRCYLLMLSTRAKQFDWVAGDMSQKWLAKELDVSERTVSRYIAQLQELKLIYVVSRKYNVSKGTKPTNIYGAYEDKDKLDKLDVLKSTSGGGKFKISVSIRYNDFVSKRGRGYSDEKVAELIRDVKRYNKLAARESYMDAKDLSVFEKYATVDVASVDSGKDPSPAEIEALMPPVQYPPVSYPEDQHDDDLFS